MTPEMMDEVDGTWKERKRTDGHKIRDRDMKRTLMDIVSSHFSSLEGMHVFNSLNEVDSRKPLFE
jgi:hypothetical protein